MSKNNLFLAGTNRAVLGVMPRAALFLYTRRREEARFLCSMKIITTLLFVVTTLMLGACAHDDCATMQSHQTTTRTGYSK